MVLQYNLQEAYKAGFTEHPEKVLKALGISYTRYQAELMGDCIFIEVNEMSNPMPVFMKESTYVFPEERK